MMSKIFCLKSWDIFLGRREQIVYKKYIKWKHARRLSFQKMDWMDDEIERKFIDKSSHKEKSLLGIHAS